MKSKAAVRRIPSMEQLITAVTPKTNFGGDSQVVNHAVRVQLLRKATQEVRANLLMEAPTFEYETEAEIQNGIMTLFSMELYKLLEPSLKKVINGTGIVLHTNLGRAPMGARAQALVASVMTGYSSLEYDLTEGRRGERYSHIERRLVDLTGAEAALAVNNNAAAVLLALTGIARGKEVIVSRGELVEIGGSFRIPEVIRQSGAVMIEVGTTNKTRLSDFDAAVTSNTAAILKVHPSNFAIVGFTSQPTMEEICCLARQKNLVSINDVGSGTLLPISHGGKSEPTVQECVQAGFDLVTFSGDKLLGAAQAGIIVGKKHYIDALKTEPLMRALRIDKLSLAALEGTLIDYSTGLAEKVLPVWSMMNMQEIELTKKAEALGLKLKPLKKLAWTIRVVKTSSLSGGGSLPEVELSGVGIEAVPHGLSVDSVVKKLRLLPTPIICLVRDNALVFDVRCIFENDMEYLCNELIKIAGAESQ